MTTIKLDIKRLLGYTEKEMHRQDTPVPKLARPQSNAPEPRLAPVVLRVLDGQSLISCQRPKCGRSGRICVPAVSALHGHVRENRPTHKAPAARRNDVCRFHDAWGI